MSPDVWIALALLSLLVAALLVGYGIGFCAGREHGESEALRRVDRWHSGRQQ